MRIPRYACTSFELMSLFFHSYFCDLHCFSLVEVAACDFHTAKLIDVMRCFTLYGFYVAVRPAGMLICILAEYTAALTL